VLVVDDNATNRQILLHQLLAWKMQPDCASSGEEALTMMRDAASKGKPYGFALLDFQMPEMDGLALAYAIKSDPTIGSARLIMLTSRGQLLSPTELQELHIDSCLIKPVKQGRLLECMIDGMNRLVTRTSPGKVFPVTLLEVPLPVTPPLQETRILIADDNRTNRKVTLAQLRILGFAADAVETGLEAVKALEKVSYDVILVRCQSSTVTKQRKPSASANKPWMDLALGKRRFTSSL
jgi:two-component system, sensor histidine kinase and response regulator